MAPAPFVLDARLAADTLPLAELPLCSLRLMDDARFPWLVLVPRRVGLVELFDLPPTLRAQLLLEMEQASAALRSVHPSCKLNLGALGNVVRQLHVHVVARQVGDAAWPGPVWGHGARLPYAPEVAAQVQTQLRAALSSVG